MPDLRSISIAALALALCSCRQDMHNQPRYEPYRPSAFFADGRSARPLPEGTIARGQLRQDTAFYTGRTGQGTGQGAQQTGGAMVPAPAQTAAGTQAAAFEFPADLVREFPYPVTAEMLRRGQNRYQIFCTPCHGYTGLGNGMIVQRGLSPPPSYHIDRLREAPVGHFFDVITNGYGAMYSYAARVPVADRWAIAAYIRALQLSQSVPVTDVPPEVRSQIGDPPAPQAPGAAPGEMQPSQQPPVQQRPLEAMPEGSR